MTAGQEVKTEVVESDDKVSVLNGNQEVSEVVNEEQLSAEVLTENNETGEVSMTGSEIVNYFKQVKSEENAALQVPQNVTTEAFPPPEA